MMNDLNHYYHYVGNNGVPIFGTALVDRERGFGFEVSDTVRLPLLLPFYDWVTPLMEDDPISPVCCHIRPIDSFFPPFSLLSG